MKYDFIIIGAGIVGLSTAYKLTNSNRSFNILVLEKENRVAAHQTGRNSGVIHSGIYYKPGSYRARNCVDGRHQLVDFCKEYGVAYDICGKVIVAPDEEGIPRLEQIYRNGLQNKIEDIELIDRKRLLEIEPHTRGVRAIHVPCAGIVDYIGVCKQLKALLKEGGGEIRFNQEVQEIRSSSDGVTVKTSSEQFESSYLISCGGLYSDRLADKAGISSPVRIVPFRGEYFELKPAARKLVNGLIYPLPNPEFPFLGVHFTKMVDGRVECGPNAVFAFKREGYSKLSFDLEDTIDTVNFSGFWKLTGKHWRMGLEEWYRSFSKKAFVTELQNLVPAIKSSDLTASPAGVRAMALQPDGEILDDFFIRSTEREIHVLNAPSPAATAGLSIADEIVSRAKERFSFS